MFKKTGQCGFSLMEVLFAIVVLSLGLVFVAALFPVGISYNRVVTETTMGDIETHNVDVVTEMQMESIAGQIVLNGFLDTAPGGDVRFLCQPNVRRNSNDIVMDDPTDIKFTRIPLHTPADEYSWGVAPGTHDGVPGHLLEFPPIPSGKLARRNISMLASPAVTMRDRSVAEYLQWAYPPPDYPDNFQTPDTTQSRFEQMDEAMYEVSLGRKNCCSYLYQCLDSTNKTFRFLIFYLKIDQRNRRYAMQNPAGSVAVEALDDTEDRLLPVPWRVDLAGDWFDYSVRDAAGLPLDRFEVSLFAARHDNLIDLLRVGSIIVDADPDVYPYSGLTYEIIDIERAVVNNKEVFQVRLRTELQNDLQYFWVFPPSVEAVPYRHTLNNPRRFRDVQPVIKVVEKIMDF